MFKIIFYTPESHLEIVKNAMFAAGAGKIGNYSHCAWQTLGEGQFLPLTDSHAYIGEQGKLEKVQEYKVEMISDPTHIQQVIEALKSTHPYEQPAYFVLRMENI